MKIHIEWQTGIPLEDAYGLNAPEDYGVYQIYGSHPVYGSNVLLYIGKARDQTFGTRLRQHDRWQYNQDCENVRVYTGRICSTDPNDKDWEDMIDSAEKLLIYTHQPACNSSNILTVKDINMNVHIFNWLSYGMLLPEVSAYRYVGTDKEFEKLEVLRYGNI